jgi:hypothetical protein
MAELAQDLAETLRPSPADTIERPRGEAAAGTKGDLIEWANLVVTFSAGLPTIVAMVRTWRRQAGDAKVHLEIDGDKLYLEGLSSEDERRAVAAFLAKHGA